MSNTTTNTAVKNTYAKYCPNVWVAKCHEPHEKGEVIPVTTQYGKDNDSIVFNLVGQKFKPINDDIGETLICVRATSKVLFIGNDICLKYDELSEFWTKWNELRKVFEPCNKLA